MPKRPKHKASIGETSRATDPSTDPRFANIYTDPRFRLPSKKHTRVSLDHRFSHVLEDEDFSRKATVDRYGRKLVKDTGKKELERFYRLDDEDDQSEGGEEKSAGDDDEKVTEELARVERHYDPARDGGFSTSDDDSAEGELDVDEKTEGGFPDTQVDQQGDVPLGDVSSRLAVVNLDWDNIRAVDLMAVFSSFCPPSGRVLKISVYPSEFGKDRMEREETEGPPREIFTNGKPSVHDEDEDKDENNDDESDASDEDEKMEVSLLKEDKGDDFDSSKLRHYQLERLRYYYAVLTASSAEAAKALYDSTDGTEYLTTANFFDLRFIPDDVSFEYDRPRDECTKIPDNYTPNTFVTNALQHSKVKLTWDADDEARKEVVKKAFRGSRADIEENDLKAYLGSDSSEDEEDSEMKEGAGPTASKKEAERLRLRSALGLSGSASAKSTEKKAPGGSVGDMQITFTSGLSNTEKRSVFENDPQKEETTAEKYVRRERERKRRRKEKLKSGTGEAPESMAESKEGNGGEGDGNGAEDLGFDDPFFDNPTASKAKGSSSRKERKTKASEEDTDAAARSRAELSLLMVDDEAKQEHGVSSDATIPKSAHFSMAEIIRAEKEASKRKSQSKAKKRKRIFSEGEVAAAAEVDISDPRFASALSSHEFAIDPTNARFSGTKTMRGLLEKARSKKGKELDGDWDHSRGEEGKKKRKKQLEG
ncbi:MAG: pre-rRNA-processing protein esf1 [Thelocarpon superellum]|nr:MAG: pre-rRNA-processing protein esf1 [Thelocarpon superellum]